MTILTVVCIGRIAQILLLGHPNCKEMELRVKDTYSTTCEVYRYFSKNGSIVLDFDSKQMSFVYLPANMCATREGR